MSRVVKKEGTAFLDETTVPSRSQTMNEYWEWAKRGVCNNPNLKTIFTSSKLKDIVQAKIYCEICPVQTNCLQYAIDNGEIGGVWGGLTEEERLSHASMKLAG